MKMDPITLSIKSQLEGAVFPPIPNGPGALFFCLYQQMRETQWLPTDQLEALQFRQLSALFTHALKSVPYYRDLLIPMGFEPGMELTPEIWRRVPVLKKGDVQGSGRLLRSTDYPASHGKTLIHRTSGSTGEPLETVRTQYDGIMFDVISLRNHLWHGRETTGKFCILRGLPGDVETGLFTRKGWGGFADTILPKGDAALLSLDRPVREQTEWLIHHDPDYLLTHPSNLSAIIDRFEELGRGLPNLKGAQSMGEVLDPFVRERCRKILGVPVVDLYSTQEIGNIALECPESGLLHIMSESVLAEVVDDDGNPCEVGETGRVLLTTLQSYAMPLFRYEIKDYAEVGPPCPCGRGLPTLKRIMGRTRNMMRMPNGDRRWPLSGYGQFRDIAPVRQYQMIQKTLEKLEMLVVAERPLTEGESRKLKEVIRDALRYPLELELIFVDEILPGKNGKLEAFVSEVD